MSLSTKANITDVISEFNGINYPLSGVATLFNVGGVTSGQIYDKITEAAATLQMWIGTGPYGAGQSAQNNEMVKRFEVVYAAARLANDLLGAGTITDGFNFAMEGTSVSRLGANVQPYTAFIKDHLAIAKYYVQALHQWFFVYNPSFPQGFNEYGQPVTYWNVGRGNAGI